MEEKRNKWVCIGLCCGAFICIGGLHDFYLKRWGWGIIKLLTFDFLWIGAIYDIYKMLTDNYSDNIKTKWDKPIDPEERARIQKMIEESDHEGYKKTMSWVIGSESQKSWANKVLDRKVEMINDLIINSYYKDLITEEEGNYFREVVEKEILRKNDANWWIDNRYDQTRVLLHKLVKYDDKAMDILEKMA